MDTRPGSNRLSHDQNSNHAESKTMKIYYHPVSTTSRMLLLFVEDCRIAVDWRLVDLFTGEHVQPNYLSLNPSGMVPMLEEDDGFRL
ncbi:MAG: glutathione S-transferase family protein, partial [Hylemonella sp.]